VPTSVELVLSLYSLEDSVKADLLALDGHLATCLSPWESLHQLRQDARRLQSGSASSKDVEWFGRLVADVACGADVREALVQALAQHAVRLRLRVADELTDIPWEFLYVPESGIGFVAQNPGVLQQKRPFADMLARVQNVRFWRPANHLLRSRLGTASECALALRISTDALCVTSLDGHGEPEIQSQRGLNLSHGLR